MNEYKTFEELIIKYDKKVMKLENKINKALEYIKSWILDEYSIVIYKEDDNCCHYESNAKEKLLEILGDKENE